MTCALLLRRQVPLVPAAAALTVHGEVRVQRAYYYCGRCQRSFLPYDDALGLRRRGEPGPDAAGVPGGDPAAVRGRRRGRATAVRRGAAVGLDGAAGHGRGRRAFAGEAEGGSDGRADAAGAALDRRPRGRRQERKSDGGGSGCGKRGRKCWRAGESARSCEVSLISGRKACGVRVAAGYLFSGY